MIDVTYPTLNLLAFGALRCETLADDNRYALADSSRRCDSRTHATVVVLAALTIAVRPPGPSS